MKNLDARLVLFITTFLLCLSTVIVSGQSLISSNGTGGGDWSLPGTWGGSVPGPLDTAIIVAGDDVVVDINTTVDSVSLVGGSSTTLTVNTGIVFNVLEGVKLDDPASGFSGTQLILTGTAIATIGNNINFDNDRSQDFLTIVDMSSGASMLNLGGDLVFNPTGILSSSTTSAINYNSSSAQTMNFGPSGSGLHKYNDVKINNSGPGVTLAAAITNTNMVGDLTIVLGIFDNGGFAMAEASGDSIKIQAGGTFRLSGTSVWPTGFGDSLTAGCTVEYTGGVQTVNAPSNNEALQNVLISGGSTKTLGTDLNIDGNLTIAATTTLDADAANDYNINLAGNFINNEVFLAREDTVFFDGSTTISGAKQISFNSISVVAASTLFGHATDTVIVTEDWINNGTFDANGGSIRFSGTGAITGGSTNSFNDVIIASAGSTTGPASGTINVAGNWVQDGTFLSNSGTVNFNGTSLISGTTDPIFNHLVIAGASTLTGKASDTVTVGGNWTNGNTFTHNSGTVKFTSSTGVIGGSAITGFNNVFITSAGAVLMAPTGTMQVAGDWTNDESFTHNGGLVEFNGSSTIIDSNQTTFNDVTITGTLLGMLSDTVRVSGNWVNNGTFTHNSGAIDFNSSTTVSGSSTTSFFDVRITGTLIAPAGTMNIARNWVNNGTFTHSSGTIDFTGTDTISGTTNNVFNNVTISGTLVAPLNDTLSLAGNWNNTGTFTHNNSTVDFIGGAAKGITSVGGETFSTMAVSGAGVVTLNDNVAVVDTLRMVSANIDAGTDTITLGSSTSNEGTFKYTAGTIVGSFERWINTVSTDYVFPVGTATNKNSAKINLSALTGGTITTLFTASDPGNTGLPIEDAPGDSVYDAYNDGFWTLGGANGMVATTYSLNLAGTGFVEHTILSDTTHLMKRAGAGSSWTFDGTHAAGVPDTVKRTGMSGLAQFGFGNLCYKPVTSAIAGPTEGCSGGKDTMSVTTTAGSTYSWVVSGGTFVLIGTGTDSIEVTWNAAPGGTGRTVKCQETNVCDVVGDTVTKTVTVHTLPTSPITGVTGVTTGSTFNYTVLSNTGYNYTFSLLPLPSLGVVNTPTPDSESTITWGGSAGIDTIRVVADSGTGVCPADTVFLTVNIGGTITSNGTGGGNWDDALTWSGGVPTSADSVVILSGDAVIVNADSTCLAVKIGGDAASTATLTVNSANTFTVTNGVQIDDMTSGAAPTQFILAGTATVTIGGGIEFKNDQGADFLTIVDMTAGASTLNLAGGISFPSTSFGFFDGGTTSTLNLNGTTAQTLIHTSSLTYANVEFNNAVGVTLGDNFSETEVKGGVKVASGIFNSAGFDLEFRGDWENNGTVNFNAGDSIIMAGAGPNSLKGTSTTSFQNLRIAKTSGGVTIDASADINISLTLDGGAVTSPSSNILTLLSNASRTAFLAEVTGGGTLDSLRIQRHLNNVPDDWRLLGAAVVGTDIEDWNAEIVMSGFTGTEDPISTFNSVFNYDETHTGIVDSGYTVPASTSVGLSTGVGYMIWVGQALNSNFTKTIDLRGTPRIGTQVITANYTAGVPTPDDNVDGWNLIANPFPADIIWDSVSLSPNMTPFAYVLDPATESYFAIKNGGGTDSDSSIASMQGFWVKASTGSGTVTIMERHKKTSDGNNFQKVNSVPEPGLTLTYTSNGRAERVDIRFEQGATESYDAFYDAYKLASLNWQLSNFSSLSNDSTDLAYNSLPELNQSYSVPLKISWGYPSFMTGTLVNGTINASSLAGLPASACVVLEDLDSATFTDLRTSSYTFDIPDSLTRPRFVLHISTPISKETINVACSGGTDGVAIAGGQGAGPWSYLWLNANGDTVQNTPNVNSVDTLAGIAAGDYTVLVTGSGGCSTISDTLMVTEPAVLGSIIVSTQDATCFGDNNGSINVSVNGGTLPYAFSWSSGQITKDISGIVAGNYDLNVTDSNGCVTTLSAAISEPGELLGNGTTTDETCVDDADGSVDLTTSGGAAPYSFSWSTGSTTEDLSNLSQGTYSVDITDSLGCTNAETYTISGSALVISGFTVITDTVYLSQGGSLQFTNASSGASVFEWNFGDGSPNSTLADPLHVFGVTGTFEVSLVANSSSNCRDTSYQTIVVLDEPLVGIDDIGGMGFPNVNYLTKNDGIYVQFTFDEPTPVNVQVFNIIGQEITPRLNVTVDRNEIKLLDRSDVVGIYLIRVESDTWSTTGKVIY